MYLDPFSSSTDQCNRSMPLNRDSRHKQAYANEDEEDEDLSMLSDASSGPPHFHQGKDSSEETRGSERKKSKHRKKVKENKRKQQSFHLDDTASSPVLGYSKASHTTFSFENNIVHNNDKFMMEDDSGLSKVFSTTDFQGKSALRNHFGYFKPSMTGKAD